MSRSKTHLLVFASSAALACALPAQAQHTSPDGWFLSASGMYVLQLDSDFGDVATIEYDHGWGLTVAFGHKFVDTPIRLELEYGYRYADLDQIKRTVGGSDSLKGKLETWALMVNALLDHQFDDSPVGIYAGGGLGIAYSDLTVKRVGGARADDGWNDTNFAYQFMGGLSVLIADNAVLFGGVRWFEVVDVKFDDEGFDHQSVNFELGLRFYF